MNKNSRNCLMFFALTVGILVVIGALVLAWIFLVPGLQDEPVIEITSSEDHIVVTSGEDVFLVSQAMAEGDILRVDLLVNDVLAEQFYAPSSDKMLQSYFT